MRALDPDPPASLAAVLDTAAALDVTEFEVFHLAARRWPGRAPQAARIERDFARYMFHAAAPPYVDRFCREVLAEEAAGTLRPRAYGAAPPPLVARVRFGGVTVAAVMVFVLGFMAVVITTPDPYGVDFPCEAGPGMAAVERVAEAFTGHPAPFGCDRPGGAAAHPGSEQR